MTDDPRDQHDSPEDFTVPSRATIARKPRPLGEIGAPMPSTQAGNAQASSSQAASSPPSTPRNPPPLLQHFFDGAVDLDKELMTRFANIPLMSVMRVRTISGRGRTAAATLLAQDGAAALHVEVDSTTREAHFTFTLGGMLGLRFVISRLSDMDRTHWLEPMRRETGEIAFLWSQARWESDYLICAAHRHYTNLFAFSSAHTEAAARLTNETSGKFLDWIDSVWREAPPNPRFKVY